MCRNPCIWSRGLLGAPGKLGLASKSSYKPCTKSQLPTLERRHGSTCNDLHCKDII
uniref:Uncharacterized protein n=1 Tax=Physcomitrium patens TaxID=3218 RepID=A0A2K1IIU3_PHYPA|nr:hypothetical protein PHYPA_027895 [Physcomitrium patens]